MKEIRILVPSTEPGGPNAKVHPHWEAKVITIATINEKGVNYKVIVRNEELIVSIAKKEKVNYAIAKSISTRAIELMEKIGVKVCTGNFDTVSEAIEKFLKGELYLIKICKEKLS